MKLFRIKSLNEIRKEASKSKLTKNLGAIDLVLLGLGAIIGTGVFVLTGLAAARYAGPSITLSFLMGAIACIFTALAYSELASMLPVAGSAYTYAYVTLGEPVAALVGWTVLMVFTFGGATVAAGWSGYMVGIFNSFGISIPTELAKIPSEGGWINLPAVLIVALLTLLLFRGTKDAARLNGVLVVVKLGAIALFLFTAVPHINLANWEVFAPHGFFGVAAGAGFVFMAYTGFDTLATAAEECKNPNRDLPIGIIVSLVGSAILYIVVAAVLTSIVPYATLNLAEPMAYALRVNGISIGAKIVAAGAIAGMTTVMLTQIYGQSRILMVMARDGMMPSYFTRIHTRFGTPHWGVLVTGIIMMFIAGFMPVSTLGQLSSMATLAVFSFVSMGVMIMRYTKPNEKRPFRCPAVYLVSSISTFLCIFLFFQLLPENWKPYLFSSLLGVFVYLFYGYRHSTMRMVAITVLGFITCFDNQSIFAGQDKVRQSDFKKVDFEPSFYIRLPEKTLIYSRSELLLRRDVTKVQIDSDVSYSGRKMIYTAVPLKSLFSEIQIPKDAILKFQALDGFSALLPQEKLLNSSKDKSTAYLAIEPRNHKWPPLNPPTDQHTAGPFYLVWVNPKLSNIVREEWPYQLVGFELKKPLRVSFPVIFPDRSLVEGHSAEGRSIGHGFKVFTSNCFTCHTLNGQGESNLGPDLNIPMNPTEYFTPGALRNLIRDPQSLRSWPLSKMHGFPKEILSEADLDDLLSYLKHMAKRKVQ